MPRIQHVLASEARYGDTRSVKRRGHEPAPGGSSSRLKRAAAILPARNPASFVYHQIRHLHTLIQATAWPAVATSTMTDSCCMIRVINPHLAEVLLYFHFTDRSSFRFIPIHPTRRQLSYSQRYEGRAPSSRTTIDMPNHSLSSHDT